MEVSPETADDAKSGRAASPRDVNTPEGRSPDHSGYEAAGKAVPKAAAEDKTPSPNTHDEWRAAKTPTGQTYYYNRRTRESSWRLPVDAQRGHGARILAPKSAGKMTSRTASTAGTATGTAAAISTPSRNPDASGASSAMTQVTPEGVDPQMRQRIKGSGSKPGSRKGKVGGSSSGRERANKGSIGSVGSSKVRSQTTEDENTTPNNGNIVVERNKYDESDGKHFRGSTSKTSVSTMSMSRAESAAKSASRVLENSRIYKELDRTFTNELRCARIGPTWCCC